jgi:hypothetical protein
MSKPYDIEIIHEYFPEWPGNLLYKGDDQKDKAYAMFCGIQDYQESFYPLWQAGIEYSEEFDTPDQPGDFVWEFICKGMYHLYEDGEPTGVALKYRGVNGV